MNTILKWIGVIFLVIIALAILGSAVNFVIGWLTKPTDIFGVDNVENQWRFAYDTEEDLTASARQVCNAENALLSATSDWEKQQRQTQLTAQMNNYARIASDYNGRVRDAFRAGLVKPPDVRDKALTLEEAINQLVLTENLDCNK